MDFGIRRDGGTIRRLEQTKTVSFLGGICLLINAMTGAGIPFTASSFQSAGWIIPMALFFIFACVSSFSVLFIIEAMQAIPGNKHFQGTVEFSTLINFYFGPAEHLVGQFLLFGAIQAQAMQNIVLSSQGIDNLIIEIFKKTCGLQMPVGGVNGTGFQWICVDGSQLTDGSGSPFGNLYMLFTIGFLCVILLSVPLGMTNLDDNINVQIGAFILTCVIVGQWMLSSILSGFNKHRVQPVSIQPGFANILGTTILNFSCTIFAPSWINLKHRSVNAQATVWTTAFVAIVLYTGVGVFPALGYELCQYNNILPALVSAGVPLILSKITVYAFSFVMLLPAIPVSFIVAQNNLTQNGVMNKTAATIACKVLPWILCIPMLTGPWLSQFINWTGIFLTSPANFVIPFVIYLKCLKFRTDYNSNRELTPKQKYLLKEIHYQSRTIANFIDAKLLDPKTNKLLVVPERTLRRGTVAMPSSLLRGPSLLSRIYTPSSTESLKAPEQIPLNTALKDPTRDQLSSSGSARMPHQEGHNTPKNRPAPTSDTIQAHQKEAIQVPPSEARRNSTPVPPVRHDSAMPEGHHHHPPPAQSRPAIPPIRIDSANNPVVSVGPMGPGTTLSPVQETVAVTSSVRFTSPTRQHPDVASPQRAPDSQATLDNVITSPVHSIAGLLPPPAEGEVTNESVDLAAEPWLDEDVPDPEEEDRLAREQEDERGEERGIRKLLSAATFRGRSRSRSPSPVPGGGRESRLSDESRLAEDTSSVSQAAPDGAAQSSHFSSARDSIPLNKSNLQNIPDTQTESSVSTQPGGRVSSVRDSIPLNRYNLPADIGVPRMGSSTIRFESMQPLQDAEEEEALRLNDETGDAVGKSSSSNPDKLVRKRKLARRGKDDEVWRRATLPYNPQYVTPTFRSVPMWLKIKPRAMAVGLMSLTIFLSIGNVIIAALGAAGIGSVGGGGCPNTNNSTVGNATMTSAVATNNSALWMAGQERESKWGFPKIQ